MSTTAIEAFLSDRDVVRARRSRRTVVCTESIQKTIDWVMLAIGMVMGLFAGYLVHVCYVLLNNVWFDLNPYIRVLLAIRRQLDFS